MQILLFPVPSFNLEFSILRSKIPTSPNPKNKTGWSYDFEDNLKKTKLNYFQKILPEIPNKPGYIIFSIIHNNQTKTIKILNSYENMRLHLKSLKIFDWLIQEIYKNQISKITIQIAFIRD